MKLYGVDAVAPSTPDTAELTRIGMELGKHVFKAMETVQGGGVAELIVVSLGLGCRVLEALHAAYSIGRTFAPATRGEKGLPS